MTNYEFTSDLFSNRIPEWKILLSHLKGEPAKCVEIGSHEGRSAIWLAENILTHRGARLLCVDPWLDDAAERRFNSNRQIAIEKFDAEKIFKCKGNSWDVLTIHPFAREIDFVYIDGSHEGRNVLEDAVLAFRMCKPGATIIFDDYQWTSKNRFYPPKPAIDAFLQLWGPWIELLHMGILVAVKVK